MSLRPNNQVSIALGLLLLTMTPACIGYWFGSNKTGRITTVPAPAIIPAAKEPPAAKVLRFEIVPLGYNAVARLDKETGKINVYGIGNDGRATMSFLSERAEDNAIKGLVDEAVAALNADQPHLLEPIKGAATK